MFINDSQSVPHRSRKIVRLGPQYLLQQVEHLNEIRTILTHPFFTGHCPQCQQSIQISDRVLGESRCRHCGWEEQD